MGAVAIETPLVEVTEDEDVVTFTLNRPAKLNALTPEMVAGLRDGLEQLAADPGPAVLLTGAGETLSAGADIEIITDDEFSTASEFEHDIQSVRKELQVYPRPTVTACKGAAVGAALGWALECDFAVVGDETTLSYPEVQLGFFGSRTAEVIERLAGTQIAKEIVLTGDPIAPERAHAVGLVSELVPEAEVDEAARAFVGELADLDAGAYRTAKEVLAYEYDVSGARFYPE